MTQLKKLIQKIVKAIKEKDGTKDVDVIIENLYKIKQSDQ